MNALLLRNLGGLRRSSSLQSFAEYRQAEAQNPQMSSVTSEGTLLEYETLELRIHPPNVVIDNDTYDDVTVITIDSANRPGTLVEASLELPGGEGSRRGGGARGEGDVPACSRALHALLLPLGQHTRASRVRHHQHITAYRCDRRHALIYPHLGRTVCRRPFSRRAFPHLPAVYVQCPPMAAQRTRYTPSDMPSVNMAADPHRDDTRTFTHRPPSRPRSPPLALPQVLTSSLHPHLPYPYPPPSIPRWCRA